MKIQIKNRWTGTVIVEGDFTSLAELVTDAVRRRVSLRAADLRAADLSAADLRAADLRAADLRAADLSAANLRAANLRAANLRAADLSAANLSAANLSAANLSAAVLTPIRDDIWAVLSSSPAEVAGLLLALKEGRVDGSTYSGACACLIGTLANVRHCEHNAIPGLKPNPSRPAERWFLNIQKGAQPKSNQHCKLAIEWVTEWLSNMRTASKAGAFAE